MDSKGKLVDEMASDGQMNEISNPLDLNDSQVPILEATVFGLKNGFFILKS